MVSVMTSPAGQAKMKAVAAAIAAAGKSVTDFTAAELTGLAKMTAWAPAWQVAAAAGWSDQFWTTASAA